MDKIKICDCGCGGGSKTRILAELTEHPELIYGVDYSKNSIKHCMDMNDLIHYEYADLTVEGGGIPFDDKFDGITSFVVFMHFGTENEIMGALNNIYSALKEKGLFLWYECNAKNHWDGKKKNVDGWGFSEAEMDKYASAAGFKLKKKYGVCSILPILNKSTVYMAKNIWNIWMLELLERLPFEKKYNVRIYSK